MAYAFTLHLPAEAPYRGLAADVAARFAESAGRNAAEAKAFGREVAAGVDKLALPGTGIDLIFDKEPSRLEVAIRCGGQDHLVRHLLPTVRS